MKNFLNFNKKQRIGFFCRFPMINRRLRNFNNEIFFVDLFVIAVREKNCRRNRRIGHSRRWKFIDEGLNRTRFVTSDEVFFSMDLSDLWGSNAWRRFGLHSTWRDQRSPAFLLRKRITRTNHSSSFWNFMFQMFDKRFFFFHSNLLIETCSIDFRRHKSHPKKSTIIIGRIQCRIMKRETHSRQMIGKSKIAEVNTNVNQNVPVVSTASATPTYA